MTIRLLNLALSDLRDGFDFYERQSPGVGTYFRETMFSDIDSLCLFPGMHRKTGGFHKLLSRRFPYAIYYEMTSGVIEIWRILDNRRDPAWIRRELNRSRSAR